MATSRQGRALAACGALLALAGCGPVIIAGPAYRGAMKEAVVDATDGWWVPWKIAVIDVDGVITDSDQTGLFSRQENAVARFREQLQYVEDDLLVEAVIVRVNSPGGGVTASDVMYHELRAFRERSKKPVVVCVMDIGASGAYYLALAGDHVVAHPTAVVGGIGVLMQLMNVEGLFGKIGLKGETIKSGEKKDIGSPLRPMTDEERVLLQEIVDSLHTRFVTLITERRSGLDEAAVRELADGRVYTAEEALKLRLIDQIGYLADAAEKAKGLADITKARLVMYHRPLGYKATAYSRSAPGQVNLLNIDLGGLLPGHRPLFLYLWAPGQ